MIVIYGCKYSIVYDMRGASGARSGYVSTAFRPMAAAKLFFSRAGGAVTERLGSDGCDRGL